jgi:hypothetical protein
MKSQNCSLNNNQGVEDVRITNSKMEATGLIFEHKTAQILYHVMSNDNNGITNEIHLLYTLVSFYCGT